MVHHNYYIEQKNGKNINRIQFYRPESKCNVGLHFARSRVKWVIDVVSNVGSKEPVIAAIAEQVANGHGSVRETMDEKSFKNTLGVVSHPAKCSNTILKWHKITSFKSIIHNKNMINLLDHFTHGLIGSSITKKEPRSLIDPSVDSQRSSIFNQKDSLVSNLRPKVLKRQSQVSFL